MAFKHHIYENLAHIPEMQVENVYEEVDYSQCQQPEIEKQSDGVIYGEMDFSRCETQADQQLQSIFLEVEPRSEQEIQEMKDYVQAQMKSKFLFDGENLIVIKPKKISKLKALIGKARLMKKRMSRNGSTKKIKKITGDPSTFDGVLAEYFQEMWVVPLLIDRITGNLELRDRVRSGTYIRKADETEVRKVKEIFRRGNVPGVVLCTNQSTL